MPYEFDTSEWPVVQFRFIGRLAPAERDQHLQDATSLLQGDRPYACVFDGREMLMPDSDLVRQQSELIKVRRADIVRLNRGTAFVTASAMISGVVRAVFFFQPFPVRYAFFQDEIEAKNWARASFERFEARNSLSAKGR